MIIVKRDGSYQDFDLSKIERAIIKAMEDTREGVDESAVEFVLSEVKKELNDIQKISVEEIQDLVEQKLMESHHKTAAKEYIIYRYRKTTTRKNKKSNYKFLTDDFISPYKHKKPPMTPLGEFVFYRTYSRYIPDENRREEWWETVRRAVEYNCSLAPTSVAEAQTLYDNIFNLKQFPSGRTLWTGGTAVSKHYPLSNYNCAGLVVDSFDVYPQLFYLLMVGAGVGLRVTEDVVAKLPKVRSDFNIIHEAYTPMEEWERTEFTELTFSFNTAAKITIGDSKEGWTKALSIFLQLLYDNSYRKVETIIINYNNIRPRGERLKTFGGTASGHQGILTMFKKIEKVIKNRATITQTRRVQLKPIDCLDFGNIIGENVVSGGVRRTAEIGLLDENDTEAIEAKDNLYIQEGDEWKPNLDILHRSMSNNSIWYTKKPSREEWKKNFEKMRFSGEPGFVNYEAGAKRRGDGRFGVVNPCGEILLDSAETCNLTTVNVFAFVDSKGKLDKDELIKAQQLSARMGYRMTQPELELHNWNIAQKRDRLIGTSITGWQDMVNATKMSYKEQAELLKDMRDAIHKAAYEYADQLGSNHPLLSTTVKPEGSLSQLPTVSSGVHYSHSPYYIRRVRINADDPLCKVAENLEWAIHPEIGQTLDNCTIKVIEFPVHAPGGKTKFEATALEQLENYKLFMKNYVDHNTSITVSVRDHEWEEVEQWVYDNWEDCVALSFLSLDDNFYQLAPYEAINQEEYEKRKKEMKSFSPSLLQKFEKGEDFELDQNDGCETGACPIR